MSTQDEDMEEDPIETHLEKEIVPNITIDQHTVEFEEGNVEKNRLKLWEVLGPSLDVLIENYQLPLTKSEGLTDLEYFEILVNKMHEKNKEVKDQNPELVKWSAWPEIANATGATNCSLGSQVILRLLETAGYEVEYGTPGPLTHSVAFAKSGEDYYYIDPTNGIVLKVDETIVVENIRVHCMKTDSFECPFEAVPAYPPESSVVATISNLEALQGENKRQGTSAFVKDIAKNFKMTHSQKYQLWAARNLFPDWDELTNAEYWKDEKANVSRKISEGN